MRTSTRFYFNRLRQCPKEGYLVHGNNDMQVQTQVIDHALHGYTGVTLE